MGPFWDSRENKRCKRNFHDGKTIHIILYLGKEGILLQSHMFKHACLLDMVRSALCYMPAFSPWVDREDPARLVFTSKPVLAIATSLGWPWRPFPSDHQWCRLQEGLRNQMKLPVGSAFWTPQPNLLRYMKHDPCRRSSPYSILLWPDSRNRWWLGSCYGIEAVYIDKDTNIRDFGEWNPDGMNLHIQKIIPFVINTEAAISVEINCLGWQPEKFSNKSMLKP